MKQYLLIALGTMGMLSCMKKYRDQDEARAAARAAADREMEIMDSQEESIQLAKKCEPDVELLTHEQIKALEEARELQEQTISLNVRKTRIPLALMVAETIEIIANSRPLARAEKKQAE